jgi:putative component of membrane protein insertase Oxa1/YidC/SpoIIIJ protein YidD
MSVAEYDMSNRSEHDIVMDYCYKRKLARPNVTLITALKWWLLLECVVVLLTLCTVALLERVGLSLDFWRIHSIVGLVAFVMCLKKICVLLIELYQHYAPEDVRRKCTLMPTCSEYALLALQKYNVFVALCKIYIRLTKKCNGQYYVDYP